MGFNPFEERGMPLEKQVRNWSDLNVDPYDTRSVHPYTRTRAILMNGIEVEAALFSHQLARHTRDADLKRHLAVTRRIEQQQQKMANWLIPATESVLEVTLGFEQVAVDLTAFVARTEPDPYVKAAFNFGLLEDFDHLYRYANLMDMVQGKQAAQIVGEYTEVMPGRPTVAEHRHPFDDVRRHYNARKADPLTQLHVMTVVAAEQQTMNFYMNVGNRLEDRLGRGLYAEIAQIEEQHVTHYESLLDPTTTWFERLVLHEYNECWLYHSCMQHEPDGRIKRIWEMHLQMEVSHLHAARELMKKYDKRDPIEMLPQSLPDAMRFEPNVDYVRKVLAEEIDLTANETEFISVSALPRDHRYHQHQRTVNQGGTPSEQVIELHRQQMGDDYRQELGGAHPVERLRRR